jgi:hypothetical protein
VEYVGPLVDVVNAGSTSAMVATAVSVARVAVTPSTRNSSSWCRSAPTTRHRPTTPLQTIMKAANTVSRASVAVCSPPEDISVTMRPTSITVTATARISVPNGSPTRCATTSAWCTAAMTAATSAAATIARTGPAPGLPPHVATSTTAATGGSTRLHAGRPARVTGDIPRP